MATESTRRSRYTLTNMFLSLAIVLGIVVAFVVLLPRPHYDAVKQINPTEAFVSAQRVAPYRVMVPTGLPSGWRATSAGVTGPDANHVVHLHVGYNSPQGAYVALEESNEDAKQFIELETAHGKLRGQLDIDGQIWEERFSSNQNQYALNRTDASGATIIVTGSSVSKDDRYGELIELARSLH